MPISSITPTSEQRLALDAIHEWFDKSKLVSSVNSLKAGASEFRLGGYAGTGKTTLIRQVLLETKGTVSVCAFTGKAAYVLKQKGIPATTIHSLIYEPHMDEVTKEVKFKLKDAWDLHSDLIVVDEASMVSHQLYDDLKKFNKPLLFIGDPGQLEPIGDNPNLMAKCNVTLSQIHRQALDSPIIGLATAIRTGGASYDPRKFGSKGEALTFMTKALTPQVLYGVDQVITARNATRQTINSKFRRDRGYGMFDGLHEGEKLICLKNDAELGVFNGMIMFVVEIRQEKATYFEVVVQPEGSELKFTLPVWSEPFYRELTEKDRPPKGVAKCDFGYCITCHKAQGSEWESVLVVDEWLGKVWDMARWRYTAVTRASQKLSYAM